MDTSKTPGTGASFGPVKQIDAGVLNTGYVEAGPAGGPAVMLLHGWPYDIHSFADVAPTLAAAGYRVIVPFVRGYGTTRILSDDTLRNGKRRWRWTSPRSWMRSASARPSWPASIGGRGQPTSSRRCGRTGARPWSRSAGT